MEPLFQEFKDRYQQQGLVDCDNGMILDGIINHDRYDGQAHKILFITKEHNRLNDLYTEGDYRSWWEMHVKYGFSHRISEWAYGIANDFPAYNEITHEEKEIALKSIAFINIKKTCGGATAYPEILSSYIDKSRDILQKQIFEIAPSIIVCCFRYDDLPKQLFGFKSMMKTPNGFHYQKWHETPVINFYHPSARKNKSLLYSQLKEAVNFATSN